MQELIESFIGSNGFAVQFLIIVGFLRVLIKPLSEIARAYVSMTENKVDDAALDKVLSSKIYNKLVFVLDYLTSIKLPKK